MSTDPFNGPSESSLPVPRGVSSLRSVARRIARLARKELRESLRDRRTVATLIMMPLIVYPLLGSVVQKFAVSHIDVNSPAAIVVFYGDLDPELQALFAYPSPENRDEQTSSQPSPDDASDTSSEGDVDATQGLESITQRLLDSQPVPDGELSAGPLEIPVRLEKYVQSWESNLEMLIQDGTADVGILRKAAASDPVSGQSQADELQVLSRQGDPFSGRAAAEVERRLREHRDRVVRELLQKTPFGVSAMPLVSRISLVSSAPKESPLSAFVPLMLVLMTMTGAVYPAIDLTAGERERGTLEMLIASPVPRRDLLTGKFIAVFTVAVLTAIVNLIAMILTLYGTGFDRVILGESASVLMFLEVLALLVVFASFFSAVLLCITSFARSFREAQAWLIPLMLVSLAPGILSLMPGVRLTVGLAIIPLVNIVLLGKELFQGIAEPHLFLITLAATSSYTVIALRLAAKIFGSDTVLFGGQTSIGSHGKRTTQPMEHVPFNTGMMGLAVLVPAFVVSAGLRSRLVAVDNLPGQLVLSGILTILLFAVFPLLLARWKHVSILSAFAIREFSVVALAGSVLLGATLWTLSYEALLFGKGTLGWAKLLENPKLQELAARLTGETPLLLRLITLAIVPAVCEELFFRGFLINALQRGSSHWRSALLTSTFLFAAFHVIVDQSLTLERFPATFMLGLVLGWIRLSTGSVWPGIAMHAVSNGLLLSLTELQPILTKLGLNLDAENQSHLPIPFLAGAIMIALLGAWCVRAGSPKQR